MVLLPRNFAGLLHPFRTFSTVCLVLNGRNTLTNSDMIGAEMRTSAHYVVGVGQLHQSLSSSTQATNQSHASDLTGNFFTGTVKQLRSGRVKSPCSRRP